MRKTVLVLLMLAATLGMDGVGAQGFKFSQPDDADADDAAARQERIAQALSTPCRAAIKNKKIMVVIGELQSDGVVSARQQNYGRHFQAINTRLRSLGLRTYTPEEIRRQVAQTEIDAYFRNDPDAALAASRKLGANFVLRGIISSRASRNPMIAVNQVSVDMGFTLSGSDGRPISSVDANSTPTRVPTCSGWR